MRFLVDECTGRKVAEWLREQNHEVFSVYDEVRGMTDDEVIQKAFSENWILITNDKDFGEKIYRDGHLHKGVIFLRLENERAVNKIVVIEKLLENHSENLANKFVVVTETKIRFSQN